MSVFVQHQGEPLHAASPAVESIQNAVPGTSQNTPKWEVQTSEVACQKIEARQRIAKSFQQYTAQLIPDQHSVTVTSDPLSVEEKICLTVCNDKKVVSLAVKNCGVATVHLNFCESELVKDIFTVTDCNGNNIKTLKDLPLGPGAEYKLKVHFCSEHAGFYEHLLVFKFKTHPEASDKMIMRLLEVIRQTSFSEEPLPTATNLCDLQTAVPKDDGRSRNKILVPLKFYAMPHCVKDLKQCNMHLENMPLNWINYWQRFKLLLHIEELQMRTEIEKLSQDVSMFSHKSHTDLVFLQVAGISRMSPSLLSGLQVWLTPLDQKAFPRKIYISWVRHVDAEKVYLELNDGFLSCFKEGMRFHISFAINRMPLRNQHRAAELVYKCRLREVLFPTGQSSSHRVHLHRAFGLENNPEQRKAVEHIVAASAKPAPYLVFGPPGTGKTVTLVEAIKRIVKTRPSCNILACAPSNSATDNLCEKILQDKIAKPSVYRLYALSCSVTKIPEMIKSCCNLNQKTKRFEIPLKAELMSHKIMVTSLQTASRLVSKGIPSAHYSYLFVDEASYSAETECLIPLAGLLKPHKCQVVLAGDPKQLGPIISSMLAETHGLGVSMLERLMNIDLYKRHETYGFNNRFVSKLLRNYRSHPAILKVPNELFYDGELQSYADTKTTSSFCRWEQLPRKGFPLIFHGVAGTNERDTNDPSVYNMAEVDVLKEYLKALVAHFHKKGVNKIEPNNIGIIVPYRKQVEKISKAFQVDKDLRKENLENVLVGSVEQFQGKEFNVTLVSTVRSMTKLTAANQKFTLGFVDNERRFNVAMTRAQALLIVVGDPRVLKTDHNWNTFIHYCATNGCYRGITVSDAEEDRRASVEGGAATGETCCTTRPHTII